MITETQVLFYHIFALAEKYNAYGTFFAPKSYP